MLRIEINLERFAVVSEIVIRWIPLLSAGITHAGANNTGQAPKLGVRRPESAQGERRCFDIGRGGIINRRSRLVALGMGNNDCDGRHGSLILERFLVFLKRQQQGDGEKGSRVEQSLHG